MRPQGWAAAGFLGCCWGWLQAAALPLAGGAHAPLAHPPSRFRHPKNKKNRRRYPGRKDENWWLVVGDTASNSLLAIKRVTLQVRRAALLPAVGRHRSSSGGTACTRCIAALPCTWATPQRAAA